MFGAQNPFLALLLHCTSSDAFMCYHMGCKEICASNMAILATIMKIVLSGIRTITLRKKKQEIFGLSD